MMRRLLLWLLFSILFIHSLSFCQPGCGCTPKTLKPIRLEAKHRSIPTGEPSGDLIKVSDVLSWDIPSKIFEEDPKPLFDREQKVFTVTGFVRSFKLADDDCDIHIEMSETKSPTSRRIIVEIPNTPEYCAVRTDFLNQMKSKHKITSHSKEFTTKTGFPKITATGFAFRDTAHWSRKEVNNKKGHGHGTASVATLWELHPVWKVNVE